MTQRDLPPLVEVRALPNHQLFVRFANGLYDVYDITHLLAGPVFQPLRDPKFFAHVKLGETGAPERTDGADLALDGLFELLSRKNLAE